MVKPNWNDAPQWANYLTHDRNGWYWHEKEPMLECGKYWSLGSCCGAVCINLYIEGKPE